METDRPFSGPLWVSLAGLTLVALAAASFTAKLTHELNLPRPDNSATVVVIEPKELPPPSLAMAAMLETTQPREAAARPVAKPRRAPRSSTGPAADEAPLVVTPVPVEAAPAASESGRDVAAAPIEPALQTPTEPEPEPGSEPTPEPAFAP